jgi:methylglutaconyl-CoA hydratase
MSTYTYIHVTLEAHIATVSINRPEARNALNAAAIRELTTAFTTLSADSAVRCVLLRGSGTDAFCAGADLQELQSRPSPTDRRDLFSAIATLVTAIQQCPTPVVSLVYGFALAGGLGLIAASDIVIAADDAQFGLPEVAVGLAPLVVTAPLTQSMTARGLAHVALSGERINAAEALRIGLVTRIVPKDSALSEALALCTTISQRGPAAVRATKTALLDARRNSSDTYIFELADRSALVSLSDEASEGIKAFTEKRAPTWKITS